MVISATFNPITAMVSNMLGKTAVYGLKIPIAGHRLRPSIMSVKLHSK